MDNTDNIDDLVAFMLEDLDHKAVDALAVRIAETLAGNRQGVILAALAMMVVVVCRKAGDHRDELSQAFCRLVALSMDERNEERVPAVGAGQLCEHCEVNPAQPEHRCPYKYELFDDEGTTCECCAECEQQCRDDV